jgi:very-short-patch-repair endonuclease
MARNLRNNQTSQERLGWNILRRKKLAGHKFLRQHPIFYSIRNDWVDFYIAEFYCAKLKLIIEIDGKIHESQKEYDQERDSKLLEKAFMYSELRTKK